MNPGMKPLAALKERKKNTPLSESIEVVPYDFTLRWETLKRHLPFCGEEGLQELKPIAIRYEEKIYTTATSQSDYLRKISLKMLTTECKSQSKLTSSMYFMFSWLQQQPVLGSQPNVGNMQQSQFGKISEMQQRRMLGPQNNIPNIAAQQPTNHQNMQPHLMDQQSNIQNLHWQQLVHQSHVGGQQLIGTNQHQSVHMVPQTKVAVKQETQNVLPGSVGPQQQQSHSNALLQNMQQQKLFQSQRATKAPSTAETGCVNVGDWQEGVYPKRHKQGFQKITYGPYGNGVPTNWAIESNGRIKRIMIKHGSIVDGIGFETGESVVWFSGSGGVTSEVILDSDEFITQITGTVGRWEYNQNGTETDIITSLMIHTNGRPEGYGPFGLAKDVTNNSSFRTPLLEGNVVVGFCGRVRTYLESIGVSLMPVAHV